MCPKRDSKRVQMYVFQTVNAPQMNKMSFHQAPIISFVHTIYFPKYTGYMANVCYG